VNERRYREIVTVQQTDRLNLAYAVSEKHAVGRVQIARHGVELMRGQADGRRQLEHHPARDAGLALRGRPQTGLAREHGLARRQGFFH
jgi:hypothetical protein